MTHELRMQRKHISIIQASEMMTVLKKSGRCNKVDRVRNEDVRRSFGQEEVMKEKHTRWKGRKKATYGN